MPNTETAGHTLWIPADQTMRGMEPGAGDKALCRPDMLALGVLYGGYTGAEAEQQRVLRAVNAFGPLREALRKALLWTEAEYDVGDWREQAEAALKAARGEAL